jgi:hypothetical protein
VKNHLFATIIGFWIAGLLTTNAQSPHACKHTIDTKEKRGDGSSLRLDYDVDAPKAFNGFWMKLGGIDKGNNFDASGFKKLTFWVKGEKGGGVPAKFRVELKGDAGDVIGQYYVGDVKPECTRVEVPLEVYVTQGVQLAALNEMTIGFENKSALPGAVKGVIWVDDIVLEGDGSPLIISDFNNPETNNLGGHWGTYSP